MVAVVVFGGGQNAAAGAKPAKVHDRFGEHGNPRRCRAVGTGGQALTERHLQFVESPAMGWVPLPCLGVVGRDEEIGWAGDVSKKLMASGRWFDNRHGLGPLLVA